MNIYKVIYNLHFLDDGEILHFEDARRALTAGAAKEMIRDLYTEELVKVEVLKVEAIYKNGKFVK